jgi:glycosyltransferase involved in cell wall biosynthesis
MLESITPLIITHDEAMNIHRTLAQVSWARRIVIVDSGSTDETLAIAGRYAQVETGGDDCLEIIDRRLRPDS